MSTWLAAGAAGGTTVPTDPPAQGNSPAGSARIVVSSGASAAEILGARELARYLYLRTGALLIPTVTEERPSAGIVVARKDRAVLNPFRGDEGVDAKLAALGPQEYWLKTLPSSHGPVLLVVGGDETGALYGAYRVAEHFGVRFHLAGDLVPDRRIALELPQLEETGRPLFRLRGLNPWGSHPPGFDTWDAGHWKFYLSQMVKLRMNFVGLHSYPEGAPYAEPTVWLGLERDFDEQGRVRVSYPANYYTTLAQGHWGPILPKATSRYHFGGDRLFERDDWGSDVMRGHAPQPLTPAACNEVFNRAGEQWREVFTFARRLGVKTCVGTEAPLTLPRLVRERLQARGRSPEDAAVLREAYETMFRRIVATHPLDYFWLWTPEDWTWQGNAVDQTDRFLRDLRLAHDALERVRAPFRLATSGWVLGPAEDRALLDRALPRTAPVSALNRKLGKAPVDPAFDRFRDRDRWSILWLEDDTDNGLAAAQLWVGRTRRDAADALAYGCTGLIGLHWRTDILAPNVSALAQAAWSQNGWNPAFRPGATVEPFEGPIGGTPVTNPALVITNRPDATLYRSCRFDLHGYRFKAPPGRYRVTLRFCDAHFRYPGQHVFDVKLQDRTVVTNLDIIARVGRTAAWDCVFDHVAVTNGWLQVEFVPKKSLPCISALEVTGSGFSRKINCGGPAWQDYAADDAESAPDRALATGDFYPDWAAGMFGPEAAAAVAQIFARLDGKVPAAVSPACPAGALKADPTPWAKAAAAYRFVEELEQLQPRIVGAGNRARFDYWLNTFRYHRSLHRTRCALGEFETAMARVNALANRPARGERARELAVPAYREVLARVAETYQWLLLSVESPAGLATVVNLENNANFWPLAVEAPGRRLAEALGAPLPPELAPSREYRGPARIIVPTARTQLETGEPLRLKVIVLDEAPPRSAHLRWRALGEGEFASLPLTHIARGVFEAQLPAPPAQVIALEYHLEVVTRENARLVWPPSAPALNHTVVMLPEG